MIVSTFVVQRRGRDGDGKCPSPQTERTCVTFTIVAWEGKKVTAHSPQRRIYTVLLYSFHWCCEDGVNRLELLPTIISFTIYLISIFSTKISSQNTSYAYRSSVVEVWLKYSVFCIYQFLSSKKNPPFCCIFIYIRWNYDVHDIRVKITPKFLKPQKMFIEYNPVIWKIIVIDRNIVQEMKNIKLLRGCNKLAHFQEFQGKC